MSRALTVADARAFTEAEARATMLSFLNAHSNLVLVFDVDTKSLKPINPDGYYAAVGNGGCVQINSGWEE